MKKFPFASLLLPILIVNGTQLWGVLFRGQPISEAFFLFWFEFVLVAVFTVFQTRLYFRHDMTTPKRLKDSREIQLASLIIVIFILLSVFFLIVYGGEGNTKEMLPAYMGAQLVQMLILFCNYLYVFWDRYLQKKLYLTGNFDLHTRVLAEKGAVFAIIYLLYIMQYHASGVTALVASRGYLVFMVTALVVGKTLVELFVATRNYRRSNNEAL